MHTMTPEFFLGISGPSGAGKGTLVRIVQALLDDFCIVSSGEIIADIIGGYGLQAQQEAFVRIKKERGDRWLHELLLERWQKNGKQKWGFDGVRTEQDVDFVRQFPRWQHWHVTADFQTRYRRVRKRVIRKEPGAKPDEATMTPEQFHERQQHETASFLDAIERRPDVTVFTNNEEPEKLGASIIARLLNTRLITLEELAGKRSRLGEIYASIQP